MILSSLGGRIKKIVKKCLTKTVLKTNINDRNYVRIAKNCKENGLLAPYISRKCGASGQIKK